MSNDEFVNLANAREEEQRTAMERILERGECPFCPENLSKEHQRPVIHRGQYWILTENQWPYVNTRVHLLLIAVSHVERLSDLPPEAGAELLVLCQWIERHYNVKGGALGMRFGNPRFNAASVKHLHAQFISANITDQTDPNYQPVHFRVG